ncbi:hypothetical protein [Polaribacter sp. IC073]|uniref:hypothetical protein n=1 Tax=Polaribacter sp. IC073 TaxID=2508540 RepID=UPI0011BDE225|nr:hypothetical protein [Polaribacter sp. IC073]TXD48682.1 hypothetical protein ES045_05500 [Polaribacter sp. IC073]
MGYWNRMIGREPVDSQLVGVYTKRKESNLKFYKNRDLTKNEINLYSSKREIKSKIIAHKYATGSYKIQISSEVEYCSSFFGSFAIFHPRSYLLDVVAPLEDIGGLVKFQLSDLKINKFGIVLLANSNIAILSLSKNDSVEYYR